MSRGPRYLGPPSKGAGSWVGGGVTCGGGALVEEGPRGAAGAAPPLPESEVPQPENLGSRGGQLWGWGGGWGAVGGWGGSCGIVGG